MIGSLSGSVDNRNGNTVIVDVNGVGYELTLTGAALELCGPVGSRVRLIVYTDVRETAISLYGFKDILEKQVFLLTKKVKGIGSKIALCLLSTLGAEGLLVAVGQQNVGMLQRVPGIGKKTAERIIVELRETVADFVNEQVSEERGAEQLEGVKEQGKAGKISTSGVSPLAQNDALLALEKLGVSTEKARQAVSLALSSGANVATSGDLVKLALANL